MNTNSVTCSHILQKHNKSRRPFDSFRNKDVTRTKDEARERLVKIMQELKSSGITIFTDLAKQYSECSSAANGGSLGQFGRGEMQQAFEEAAFKLKVGELSDIVDSDSGLHIILRTK